MHSLHHANSAVKTPRTLNTLLTLFVSAIVALLLPFAAVGYATFTRTRRYYVPNTEHTDRPLTAAFGYLDEGILRSVRTRGGRHYDGDRLNFLVSVLDAAEHDGLDTAEVVITYKRIGVTVTYSTSIEALREHGDLVMGVSGWELSMPISQWSIDGAKPVATTQPAPAKVAATVGQPALFDMPVGRKGGY